MRAAAAIVLSVGFSASVLAADVKAVRSTDAKTPNVILVVGELVQGDDARFGNAALQFDKAVVFLHSPGGLADVGMAMGRAIRVKGFDTVVIDGYPCASACALAWLAGNSKLMQRDAKVGFHAIYRQLGGSKQTSSTGNALVGAYLNQLGYPAKAIAYITEADPNAIQWMSLADARRVGIDAIEFGGDTSVSTPAPPPKPMRQTDIVVSVPLQGPAASPTGPVGPATSAEVPSQAPVPIRPVLDLLNLDSAARVQMRLLERGYLQDGPDGVWGLRSRIALREFKRQNGLPANDAWDRLTEEALFSVEKGRLAQTGIRAETGTAGLFERVPPPAGAQLNPLNPDDATTIQTRLSALGFYRAQGDGTWGLASRAALREFKLANRMADDDVWDAAAEARFAQQNIAGVDTTIFGTWSPKASACGSSAIVDTPMRVSGTSMERGPVTCSVNTWAVVGNAWSGTATCQAAGYTGETSIVIELVLGKGKLVDRTGRPFKTFFRCP